MRPGGAAEQRRSVFYYDLRDPESYFWAERVNAVLPVVPEWVPVALAREPAFRCAEEQASYAEDLERSAARLGLQPVRLPSRRAETDLALRAATYAKQIGRAVAFSLAAFRQAFAGGRDLDELETVLIAGAACEIHPNALTKAVKNERIAQTLRDATQSAGIDTVPVVVADGDCIERLPDMVRPGQP